MRRLDVGSGRAKLEGYETLDREPAVGADYCADIEGHIAQGLVGQFDEVRAHHVLEHVRPWKKVWAMRWLWEVLKPGGTLDIEVPLAGTDQFWQDPTHMSGWVPMSFRYFEKGNRFGEAFAQRNPWSPLFEMVEGPKVEGWRLSVKMRKPI